MRRKSPTPVRPFDLVPFHVVIAAKRTIDVVIRRKTRLTVLPNPVLANPVLANQVLANQVLPTQDVDDSDTGRRTDLREV